MSAIHCCAMGRGHESIVRTDGLKIVLQQPRLFEDGQMEAILTVGWVGWGVVFYMGLVMTALGYAVWYYLIGKYPMIKVVPFVLLQPIVVVISSMAIIGESLSLAEVAGSTIVMGGVAIIVTYKPPQKVPG